MSLHRHEFAFAFLVSSSIALFGCPKDEGNNQGDKPPPAQSAKASGSTSGNANAGPCANGGGSDDDPISEPFFPHASGGYCIDPQGDVKTYGEKGKLSMNDVCTTAFDGECEVYKNFGLTRVVTLRYADGTGHGGSVEVVLSQFKDVAGAYGMFTKRVVADGDPADPTAPRMLQIPGGAGAMGTGRAYVWRSQYIAELQYINEQESPEQLIKSSASVLKSIATQIGERVPTSDKPASAKALPMVNMIPNGIDYRPKDPPGLPKIGDAAFGYYRDYKDPTKRWRGLSIVRADVDAAKDVFKTIRQLPGALPIPAIPGVFDEGVRVTLQSSAEAPKVEWTIARKAEAIAGIGDDEIALTAAGAPEKQAAARVGKDEELIKLKAWLSAPPVGSDGQPMAPFGDSGVRTAQPMRGAMPPVH